MHHNLAYVQLHIYPADSQNNRTDNRHWTPNNPDSRRCLVDSKAKQRSKCAVKAVTQLKPLSRRTGHKNGVNTRSYIMDGKGAWQ